MSVRPGSRRTLAASTLTAMLGAALAVPVLLAAPAGAATPESTVTADENGRELDYATAAGRADRVSVTQSWTGGHDRLTFLIDDSAPIALVGEGCAYPDPADRTKVTCTVRTVESQDPYHALRMDLGDGDDTVTYENRTDDAYYTSRFSLGEGEDTFIGTGSVDGSTVLGEGGDDHLTAGVAAFASAGDGDDTVEAVGSGAFAVGGAGNDTLRGGAEDQHLYGEDGRDRLYGGTGDDYLHGGRDADTLYGNSGRDHLWGNSGNDRLSGGPGADTLSGGPGYDVERQD